jgi:hypothetical protein
MIYENANPWLMREPSGTLDTSAATYVALDHRRVRVEGSRFHPADQYTIKLEGAACGGYETLSLVGIRDPHILADLPSWRSRLNWIVTARVKTLLGLAPGDYDLDVRRYGNDAVLGLLEPDAGPPREIGVLFKVRADEQATATAIAKIANPYLLHLPAVAALYHVDANTVQLFHLPAINVIKASFPRPTTQGSFADRDIHAGQQHIPLLTLLVPATD